MSHNSSAAHSSRSSPRSPRYSRPPTPSSSRRSPLPSAPLSGHGAGGPSSNNYLSPAPAYYPPPHLVMNFATEHPTVPPSPNPPPTHATWPSISAYQLGRYAPHQTNWFSPPPAAPLAQAPFSLSPYHPAPVTNPRRPAPIPSPPMNFQPFHATQPSVTVHQPEDSTSQNYAIHQHQRLLHTPQPGQVVSQQGQMHYGDGMFKNARDFSVANSTFIDNSNTSDDFMDKFLQHTIIGAEFDSSDRHPPPRCHPGTRLAIIERCKNFIVRCDGEEKMRWVVGAAGVGKSAIMQIVAEEIPADASVFFSVNGRNDGTKFFATISYQLAVKYEPYRQFIRNAINLDPSLLRKSLPAQFRKFIVDPFLNQHLFNPSQRFLIIIDGLDECDNPTTQRELLGLISDFCIKYPTSPIVWIIASRPERHIMSFFYGTRVAPAYTKEEIEIDSDQSCEEVQRYLREELNNIKLTSLTLRHKREWPSGLEFTKITTAAGGLFAYASTVIRFIGNSHYRDPAIQLRHVLEDIDAGFKGNLSRKDHPMAQLDALYRRILSNIPRDVMINTRILLLTTVDRRWTRTNFRHTCNRLELSEAAAYDAVSYLHAVLKVPAPDNADDEDLEFYHKSFPDFLLDFERSGFSHNAEDESDRLRAQCSLRMVTQVSADFLDSSSKGPKLDAYGYLRGCLGFCDNIPLSWPGDERFWVSDAELKVTLYRISMLDMCQNSTLMPNYSNISFFHVLTTHFNAPGRRFPIHSLRDRAFEEFRPELTELGKLKEVPLRTLDYAAICGIIDVYFTIPIDMDVEHFDPWTSSCTHMKYLEKDVDDLQQRRSWVAQFVRSLTGPGAQITHTDIPRFNTEAVKDSHLAVSTTDLPHAKCLSCSWRLAHHFIDHPNQVATVFVDSTEMSYVEFSFVDPDDGVSEWRYRFFHSGRPSCVNQSVVELIP